MDLSDVLLANTSMASISTSTLGNLTNGAPSACFISNSFHPRLPVIESTAGLFLGALKEAEILPWSWPEGTLKFSVTGEYSRYLAISNLSISKPRVLSRVSLKGFASPARCNGAPFTTREECGFTVMLTDDG